MTIKERLLLIKKLARIYGTYEVLNSGDTFKWAHKYTFSFLLPQGFSRERSLFNYPEPTVVKGSLTRRPRETIFEAQTDTNTYRGVFSTYTNSWDKNFEDSRLINDLIDHLIFYAEWGDKEDA